MPARAPQTHPVAWPAARPRPLTGAVELRLAQVTGPGLTRPERASAVITAVFEALDGAEATPDLVRRLSSGTRAWLLTEAAALIRRESGWFEAECAACGATFDFPLRLVALPRAPAGPGFPVVAVKTSLGPRRFEVPNGDHEERLARHHGPDPRRDLAAMMGLSESAEADAALFDEADLAAIEAALDAVAPDLGDRVAAQCPECGAATEAVVDPLSFALPRAGALLHEAHLIARAYGWGEPAILALPGWRRRAYAGLIAAEAQQRAGR